LLHETAAPALENAAASLDKRKNQPGKVLNNTGCDGQYEVSSDKRLIEIWKAGGTCYTQMPAGEFPGHKSF
jgi:hypothetical protein